MITKHANILIALSLAACGVKVNGKSYGIGGSTSGGSTPSSSSSPEASSSSAPGSSSSSSPEASSSDAGSRYPAAVRHCYLDPPGSDHAPVRSGPADPWRGVDSDQPATLKRPGFTVWQEGNCTAKHDHCLSECVWFAGPEAKHEHDTTGPVVYQGDGDVTGLGGGMPLDGRTMYRTVPATKRLLTRGAVVVAVEKMAAVPTDGTQKWHIGRLDRVDWKTETLYMVGSPDPYRLSATRVAVLSWREGGKVEIVDGRKRDELAVTSDELFLPKTIVTTSDPWSQVKDGQPIVVADSQPFATDDGDCKPSNDHCLRPWAWFVDINSGYMYPAKFDGKTFQSLRAIDELKPYNGVVAAYRTVPATASNLKVGAMAFMVYSGGSEHGVHTHRVDVVKVLRVRSDGKFEGEDLSRSQTFRIDDARVPVLVWYPGEKAEAFP